MKKTLEELCGQLKSEELQAVSRIRWMRHKEGWVTTINYTFDIKSITQNLKDLAYQADPGSFNMTTLPASTRQTLISVLEKWTSSCKNFINFNYLPELSLQQSGITFLGCDNLISSSGFTAWDTKIQTQTNTSFFNRVVVCVPSEIKREWDLSTISHETGHALGISHIHNIPTLTERIRATEQGLGCSVMGYISKLNTGNNTCITPEYCQTSPYAVFPGILDGQICSDLYAPSPMSSIIVAPEFFYYGFVNGAVERFFLAFLSTIKYKELNLNYNTAKILSLPFIYLIRIYTQTNYLYVPGIVLEFLELYSRIHNNEYRNIIEGLSILTNIFCLFFSLYLLYASDNTLINGGNLLLFLGANLIGALIGQLTGLSAAIATNILTSTGNKLLSRLDITRPNKMYSSGLCFFDNTSCEAPASNQEIELVEHQL